MRIRAAPFAAQGGVSIGLLTSRSVQGQRSCLANDVHSCLLHGERKKEGAECKVETGTFDQAASTGWTGGWEKSEGEGCGTSATASVWTGQTLRKSRQGKERKKQGKQGKRGCESV